MPHECSIFWRELLECPFARLRKHEKEKEQENERPRFLVPARKERERRSERLDNITTLAVAPKELREALEKMAAFQREEGQLIPQILRSLPSSGLDPRLITAALAAIGISVASGKLGSKGLKIGSRVGRISQTRVAKGFSQVLRTAGRPGGRGAGFHVNAAAQMRALVGLPVKRIRKGTAEVPFGEEFNETGF